MKFNKLMIAAVASTMGLFLTINVNAAKKTTPDLSTYNNYGNYKVRLTKDTKIDYEKLDFMRSDKLVKTKLLKNGTIVKFSGHLSRFDGPAYVVYGKYSHGPRGTKPIIEMKKNNYKLISYSTPKIK